MFRVVGPVSPDHSEQRFQHSKTKTVHAMAIVGAASQLAKCGQHLGAVFTRVMVVISDWTLKCRVCFDGRRHV